VTEKYPCRGPDHLCHLVKPGLPLDIDLAHDLIRADHDPRHSPANLMAELDPSLAPGADLHAGLAIPGHVTVITMSTVVDTPGPNLVVHTKAAGGEEVLAADLVVLTAMTAVVAVEVGDRALGRPCQAGDVIKETGRILRRTAVLACLD